MVLHGKHCENRIMKNIPYEKGILKTVVNLPAQSVTLIFKKSKTDKTAIGKAFQKLGYKPDEVKDTVKQNENQ